MQSTPAVLGPRDFAHIDQITLIVPRSKGISFMGNDRVSSRFFAPPRGQVFCGVSNSGRCALDPSAGYTRRELGELAQLVTGARLRVSSRARADGQDGAGLFV
jgi:hypothetical protein